MSYSQHFIHNLVDVISLSRTVLGGTTTILNFKRGRHGQSSCKLQAGLLAQATFLANGPLPRRRDRSPVPTTKIGVCSGPGSLGRRRHPQCMHLALAMMCVRVLKALAAEDTCSASTWHSRLGFSLKTTHG